jgi:hypothetical protein
LVGGFAFALLLPCKIQSVSAQQLASAQEGEVCVGSERLISRKREDKRPADANALASNAASIESKPAPQTAEYVPG